MPGLLLSLLGAREREEKRLSRTQKFVLLFSAESCTVEHWVQPGSSVQCLPQTPGCEALGWSLPAMSTGEDGEQDSEVCCARSGVNQSGQQGSSAGQCVGVCGLAPWGGSLCWAVSCMTRWTQLCAVWQRQPEGCGGLVGSGASRGGWVLTAAQL